MKIYLAGPMRNKPQFNFPAFHAAALMLRDFGHEVFSPAERDEGVYGKSFAMDNATGDQDAAVTVHAFSLREALAADMKYICEEAEGIALLPGWDNSKGACAEYATALALDLKIIFLEEV